MPLEYEKLMLEGTMTSVAAFIRSRPKESAQYLISAVSHCLKRRLHLNEAELLIAARQIRY